MIDVDGTVIDNLIPWEGMFGAHMEGVVDGGEIAMHLPLAE